MKSSVHKVSKLPVGEVKPLTKFSSMNSQMTLSGSTTSNQTHSTQPQQEKTGDHCSSKLKVNLASVPCVSLSELTLLDCDQISNNYNNNDSVTKDTVTAKHITLPRTSKSSVTTESQSRIPKMRQMRTTIVPIDTPISQRSGSRTTPRGKRTGTPLQELDRKWALEQCEELTTWTSELLRSRGGKLNQDLRKAISDGTTLPTIIEIALDHIIESAVQTAAKSAGVLKEEDRLQVLHECTEYLKSAKLATDVSTEELAAGDLKAVLTVLSSIKEEMGQERSKMKSKKFADQKKLLPYDVIKQEVDNDNSVQEVRFSRDSGEGEVISIVERQASQDEVIITHGQPPVLQDRTSVKLTTFQRPTFSKEPKQTKPLKSIMKTSLSLDDLEDQRSEGGASQRSLYHQHSMPNRSSSNISINVDSGEKEYFLNDADYDLPPPSPRSSSFPPLNNLGSHVEPTVEPTVNTWETIPDANKQAAYISSHRTEGSAFTSYHVDSQYMSHRQQARAKMVRGQPSGNSSPATPNIRESDGLLMTLEDNSLSQQGEDREKRHRSPRHVTSEMSLDRKSKKKARALSTSSERSTLDRNRNKVEASRRERIKKNGRSSTLEKSVNSEAIQSRCNATHTSPDDTQSAGTLQRGESLESCSRSPRPPNHLPLEAGTEYLNHQEPNSLSLDYTDNRELLEGVLGESLHYQSTSTNSTLTPPASDSNNHSLKRTQEVTQSKRAQLYEVSQEYYEPIPVESATTATTATTRRQSQVSGPDLHEQHQTDSKYRDLTEAQIRRLSMPNGYQYNDSEAKQRKKGNNSLNKRKEQWFDNPYVIKDEQWIDNPISSHHRNEEENSSRWLNTSDRKDDSDYKDTSTQLENLEMEDSFYDNSATFDSNTRCTTPSLPALTDNTDIESVSDILHNKRYKRSASFSDRIQFSTESKVTARTVNNHLSPRAVESNKSERPSHVKHKKHSHHVHRKDHHKSSSRTASNHNGDATPREDKTPEQKVHNSGVGGAIDIDGSIRQGDERRNSVCESVTSSQRSYNSGRKGRHRSSRPSDSRISQKRIQRMESHIVTLARSVAHISSEMRSNSSIYLQLENLSAEISSIKQVLETSGLQSPLSARDIMSHQADSVTPLPDSKERAQKLNKLTKFFGQEPPLMRLFLKDLGYEKYSGKFEAEKIGLMELPYMSEEALKSIGIPLGPRTRILQEAKAIKQHPTTSQTHLTNGHTAEISKLSKLSNHTSQNSKPPKPPNHSKKKR